MIVLFTDFGLEGPYTGQVKAVLHSLAPAVPVVDLFADAPARSPKPAAYLLAAYASWFVPATVFLAVVDPGVGSDREAIILEADGRSFVGPENGLFELVRRRARRSRSWEIAPREPPFGMLSASFHGRDVFAPAAARLALGERPQGALRARESGRRPEWPDDLPQIVYIDRFGNAITGLRASFLPSTARLGAGGGIFARARTFADVGRGSAFWYENANGLAEIAVNGGRADALLRLEIGSGVEVIL